MSKFKIWWLQKKIARKTRYWQKVLRLHHWMLNGQLTEGEDCVVLYDTDHFCGTINIGIDLPSWELDIAICHELVHLLKAEKPTEEQEVELIARALNKARHWYSPPEFWEVATCVVICNLICLGVHYLIWG